jgi:hypothetical protein
VVSFLGELLRSRLAVVVGVVAVTVPMQLFYARQAEFDSIMTEFDLPTRLNYLDAATEHAPVGLTAQSWAHSLGTDIRRQVVASKAQEERTLTAILLELRESNASMEAEVEAMSHRARHLMDRSRELVEVVDRLAPCCS